ncbi:MAG: vanadium-dependent haloperoxidase [Verrucomicrobiota bacterium]
MNNQYRREAARNVRISAADLAEKRPHPPHIANGDEQKFRHPNPCKKSSRKEVPSYLASFTKGLPHCKRTGLVRCSEDFERLVKGIDSGDPRDFQDTPLGPRSDSANVCIDDWLSNEAKVLKNAPNPEGQNPPGPGERGGIAKVRAWESQGAGNTFDLEGPDAQAVTMPPAPALGSSELAAEMDEVYAQALLRDTPFCEISLKNQVSYCDKAKKVKVADVLKSLSKCAWFVEEDCCGLSAAELSRKRPPLKKDVDFFRGTTPGEKVGPYISQFLLVGNKGLRDPHSKADGYIQYGSIRIDQRVRVAEEGKDDMTDWNSWLDVQNGADLRGEEDYVAYKPVSCNESKKVDAEGYRFITTPRDLATYVHHDALYEAYLNACLILLGDGIPFDPGIPFQIDDAVDHQQGFAHFGGPHILSLVTEVATRALKAVRFQKFNIHRRFRPEVLAARFEKIRLLNVFELNEMEEDPGLRPILSLVEEHSGNHLLPMAFPEGSPMHPSYGAGHATVAGACVTILKAFFDHKHLINEIYEPAKDGSRLNPVTGADPLTVEGELNKLAANISIGRDWAGVHFYSDYIESIRMGEQIAIGILEEQKLTYGENFSMTVPLYDGGSIRI